MQATKITVAFKDLCEVIKFQSNQKMHSDLGWYPKQAACSMCVVYKITIIRTFEF